MTTQESKRLSQYKVWQYRIQNWGDFKFDSPLTLNKTEVSLFRGLMAGRRNILILGVTPELIEAALYEADSVTAVDFVQDAIDTFRVDGVHYVCQEWISFLEESSDTYDLIITDGGLISIEFPHDWTTLGDAVSERLSNEGIFTFKTHVSNLRPAKPQYDNFNLSVMMPVISQASHENNYTVVKPADKATKHPYPARYAFPDENTIIQTFHGLAYCGKFIPGYEEGDHFISFIFQKAALA